MPKRQREATPPSPVYSEHDANEDGPGPVLASDFPLPPSPTAESTTSSSDSSTASETRDTCRGDHKVETLTIGNKQLRMCICEWGRDVTVDTKCLGGQEIEQRQYEANPKRYERCDISDCKKRLVWKRCEGDMIREDNTLYIEVGSVGIELMPARLCPCNLNGNLSTDKVVEGKKVAVEVVCGAVICRDCINGCKSGDIFTSHKVRVWN